MSEWLEDFKQYLPKYLSAAATENLFAELKQFPGNIDQRICTSRLQGEPTVFQGDGKTIYQVIFLGENGACGAEHGYARIARNGARLFGVFSLPVFMELLGDQGGVTHRRYLKRGTGRGWAVCSGEPTRELMISSCS